MHVHVGVLDFLVVWAYILIGRFIANTLAVRFAHTPIGQALSLIAA